LYYIGGDLESAGLQKDKQENVCDETRYEAFKKGMLEKQVTMDFSASTPTEFISKKAIFKFKM
jgi:hypothetical protein